jgi:phosphoglycerol transferase
VYDQSSRNVVPDYADVGASYGSDRLFVNEIQKLVPAGSMIFELPYVPYPENPSVAHMIDYEMARGYVLTTTNMRWSYAAMKGRAQDWAATADELPLATLVDGAAAVGFGGIYVDRYGFADYGVAITKALESIVGSAPIVSRDERLEFFDLASFTKRLRARFGPAELLGLRRAILYPQPVAWGGGFYGDESGSRWAEPDAMVQVDNRSSAAQPTFFSADLFTLARGRWPLRISAPDGQVKEVAVGRKPTAVQWIFNDPPGVHTLSFTSHVPIVDVPIDPRSLAVRYDNLDLVSAAVAPFLTGGTPSGDY